MLTEDDILDFLITSARESVIPPAVRSALLESSLLFLGFPLDDLGFRALLRLILALEGSAALGDRAHVGVQVDPETHAPADIRQARQALTDYFARAGAQAPRIEIYWGTAADFLSALHDQLKNTEANAPEPRTEPEDAWSHLD